MNGVRSLEARTERLRASLLGAVVDDESLDSAEDRARRVAFLLTGYHAREARPVWRKFFERRENRTLEQLRDEDSEALADLSEVGVEQVGRSWQWTLSFPPQEFKLSTGVVDDPITGCAATVVAFDDAARTVVVKRSKARGDSPPRALAPGGPYDTSTQTDAIFRAAEQAAQRGLDRADPGLDLLLRRRPRFREGAAALPGDSSVDHDALAASVRALDSSALCIQGPPGTGKTYTAAHLAVRLITQGIRVGITATSHKAINNLLEAIDDAADAAQATFRGWRKKPTDVEDRYESARIRCEAAPDEAEGEVLLHAGTAWHWARSDAARSVEVLFVDEAGQVSLADAVAVAQGAKNLVLLGDPQQLPHVAEGTHALGSGASVLQHLLGDAQTVPPDRGVLLDVSWRMHPDICAFVSRSIYDGRLKPEPRCATQMVTGSSRLAGNGLRFIPVEHSFNRGQSPEEADVIAAEVASLLVDGWFTAREGDPRPLTLDDILIVAPYNAQVRCLRAKLPDGARVGTVDKFQGQQAAMVFFSMATSSGEDASRGMSFLFSRNRLNVAVSRAQALAVVVCSPPLLEARCSNVEDMRLVNFLCQFRDEASTSAPLTVSG